jgi:hypothetical protein
MATREPPAKPRTDKAVKPERRKGPTKTTKPLPPARIKGRMALKPDVEDARKRAEEEARKRGSDKGPPDGRDQQPRKPPKSPERYVRLRVRVDDGELSIVDSHVIEGPLAQASTFEGAFAYEVVHGDSLLHAGSLPDLNTVRSFAHPNGTPEQKRHHTYELSTYEFNARLPAAAIKPTTLRKIAVVLHRVKERPHVHAAFGQPLAAPLGVQQAREMREVGRVVGLPASVLSAVSPARAAARSSARTAATRKRGTKKR